MSRTIRITPTTERRTPRRLGRRLTTRREILAAEVTW
jgi:hypothetical protein